FLDEVVEHALGDLEVRDHAVAQGADCDDIGGRAPDHLFRLDPDLEDLFGLLFDGDDRGLVDDDALAAHEHKRVRRSEINADIVGEQPEYSIQRIEQLRLAYFFGSAAVSSSPSAGARSFLMTSTSAVGSSAVGSSIFSSLAATISAIVSLGSVTMRTPSGTFRSLT